MEEIKENYNEGLGKDSDLDLSFSLWDMINRIMRGVADTVDPEIQFRGLNSVTTRLWDLLTPEEQQEVSRIREQTRKKLNSYSKVANLKGLLLPSCSLQKGKLERAEGDFTTVLLEWERFLYGCIDKHSYKKKKDIPSWEFGF